MSKSEFERLQKEYIAAAIKTAEKAKITEAATHSMSDESKISSVTYVKSDPTEITKSKSEESSYNLLHNESSSTEVTYSDTKITKNENSDTDMTKSKKSDSEIDIADVLSESENIKEEITAEEIDDTENVAEAELNNDESNISEDSEESDADTTEIPQKEPQMQQPVGLFEDEEIGVKQEGETECETPEEYTDKEISESFANVFMSEEEADKKAESLSEQKQKSCSPPNFNSAINNHNCNINESTKACGCEHCRCRNGNRMQEKGGQKPN